MGQIDKLMIKILSGTTDCDIAFNVIYVDY